MTNHLSEIKSQIKKLYNENPNVLADLSFRGERNHLKDVPAVITAVYSNIFTVNIDENGIIRKHSFQYSDILTGNLKIRPYASAQQH